MICTKLVNKQTGKIAHPFAKIEVKAPDELISGSPDLTGFINIAGQKFYPSIINLKFQQILLSSFLILHWKKEYSLLNLLWNLPNRQYLSNHF